MSEEPTLKLIASEPTERYSIEMVESVTSQPLASVNLEMIRRRDVMKLIRKYEGVDVTFRFVDRETELQYMGRFGTSLLDPIPANKIREARLNLLLVILKYEYGFNVVLR